MPVKIPDDLPAAQTLLDENIFVMKEGGPHPGYPAFENWHIESDAYQNSN